MLHVEPLKLSLPYYLGIIRKILKNYKETYQKAHRGQVFKKPVQRDHQLALSMTDYDMLMSIQTV